MECFKLPENVQFEILSRLSVKSLLRFKSVSKSWYNLIKSPFFINKHLDTTTKDIEKKRSWSLLLLRLHCIRHRFNATLVTNTLNAEEEIELENMRGSVHTTSSCNGLVCIWYCKVNKSLLLNPATRERKFLPQPPKLSYQPSFVESHTLSMAFGFDRKNNDYKVVRIVTLWDKHVGKSLNSVVQIYYLSSKKWRDTDLTPPVLITGSDWHNTYANGVYYWLSYDSNDRALILSFDMTEEVFATIQIPEFLPHGHLVKLALWKGSLAIIRCPREYFFGLSFEVWAINDSCRKSNWTKQAEFGPFIGIDRPLGTCEDQDMLLLESNEGELISYDMKTQEMKHLQVYGFVHTLQVAIYKESLVSID